MKKSPEKTPTPMLNQIETELVRLEQQLDALSEILESAARLDDRTNAQIREIVEQTLSLQSRLEPHLGLNIQSGMATTLYQRVNQLLNRCGEHLGSETVSAGFELSRGELRTEQRFLYISELLEQSTILVRENGDYFVELARFTLGEADEGIEVLRDVLESINQELVYLDSLGDSIDFNQKEQKVALEKLRDLVYSYIDRYTDLREQMEDMIYRETGLDVDDGDWVEETDDEWSDWTDDPDDEEDNPIDFA